MGHQAITNTNYQFESQCYAGQQIFAERNSEYKDAFKRYGFIGVVYEILGILARLETVVIWSGDYGKSKVEKVIDILKDLHNYTVMALMLLEDRNWNGKPEPPALPPLPVFSKYGSDIKLSAFGLALENIHDIGHDVSLSEDEKIQRLEDLKSEIKAIILERKSK